MNSTKIAIVVIGLMLSFLQVRLWIGEGSLAHVSALQNQVAHKSAENQARQQRNQVLKAEIVELKSGLESIEAKARSELGMIRKGETFYLLVEETGES